MYRHSNPSFPTLHCEITRVALGPYCPNCWVSWKAIAFDPDALPMQKNIYVREGSIGMHKGCHRWCFSFKGRILISILGTHHSTPISLPNKFTSGLLELANRYLGQIDNVRERKDSQAFQVKWKLRAKSFKIINYQIGILILYSKVITSRRQRQNSSLNLINDLLVNVNSWCPWVLRCLANILFRGSSSIRSICRFHGIA